MKFFITIATAISALLMLTGCVTCAILYEVAFAAGQSKKDISNDPRCNAIIGKKFVLTDDAYLYRFHDSNELHLDGIIQRIVSVSENNMKTRMIDDKTRVPFCELVKKGTVIEVKQVLIATSFGDELCSQHILVQFWYNSQTLVTADCSRMFKNTSFLSKETWNFEPDPSMLIEAV